MHVQENLKYDKNNDCLVGLAVNSKNDETLANKMLAFLFKGLSTNLKIPVAYFPVNKLNAEQLHELTVTVIKEIEELGLRVQRLVTDNARVNVSMFKYFKSINDGDDYVVQHPCDASRKLFLSFDQSHIVKNIRNQVIDRDIIINQQRVSIEVFRLMLNLNKGNLMNPARQLKFHHVYPTNLQRQKVAWALFIFQPQCIAALESYRDCNEPGFENIDETIVFLRMIHRWFQMFDVCNTHQHVYCRLEDKAPFRHVEDERLKWLAKDFLDYLYKWKEEAKNERNFLTTETYKALVFTTKSNVEFIKYALQELKLKYVLTRKLSTDDIERFFGNVRSQNGQNDLPNVEACSQAIRKIGRTQLAYASVHGNVSIVQEKMDKLLIQDAPVQNQKIEAASALVPLLEEEQEVLDELNSYPSINFLKIIKS